MKEEELLVSLSKDLTGIDIVAKANGYNAALFRQMLARYGARETASRLLSSDAPQYGLLRLKEIGLLQHSMENIVLNPKYKELFSTNELEAAEERLTGFGFKPGGWKE